MAFYTATNLKNIPIKVFNKRKRLEFGRVGIPDSPEFDAPCQVVTLGLALDIPPLQCVLLLNQLGWSVKDPGTVSTFLLRSLGWKDFALSPYESKVAGLFAPHIGVVGVPEHLCYVEGGTLFSTYDCRDEQVELFLVPPGVARNGERK